MASQVLEKLFGSSARVRIMRLFLLNPHDLMEIAMVSRRTKALMPAVRREILLLGNIGFLENKTDKINNIIRLKNGQFKNNRKKINGWRLNPDFLLSAPLKILLVNSIPFSREDIIKRLNRAGKIKLIILSGAFIQAEDAPADMVVVGDSLRKSAIDKIMRKFEAEIGQELRYAVFTTQDFAYRMEIRDRFVRDVLDSTHEKLVNKMEVEI